MRIAVVEKSDMAVGQSPYRVLKRKAGCIVDKFELVVFATKPPDDLSGLSVDFGNLVHVSTGEQDVAVKIRLDGVSMHVINLIGG